MKISYTGQFRADIVFDEVFTYYGMNGDYHQLQDYIDKANYFIGEYGFVTAQIVDSDDENIIIKMEREENV